MGDLLRSTLKGNIRGILPHLSDDMVEDLITFLLLKGVKRESDLRRITIEMLQGELNGDLIDASDLFDNWQQKFGSTNSSSADSHPSVLRSSSSNNVATPPVMPQRSGTATPPVMPQRSGTASKQPSMPTYAADSPYFPTAVKQAIQEEKRPSASARAQMVERIVDHCRDTVPNLQRSMFNQVALNLVVSWPKSFKDTVPVSEHASDSLAKQLRDKFDNDRRPKQLATTSERAAPARKEAYGCIQWKPELPDGDSEEAQEKRRESMEEMHQLSRKHWDWKIIKTNMDGTFYLLRKEINPIDQSSQKRKRNTMEGEENEDENLPSNNIVTLRGRWPLLFTCKGMNYHFIKLTGVNLRENLNDFIKEEAETLIEFLSTKGEELAKMKRRMVRAERQGLPSARVCGLLLILTSYLKDSFPHLVKFVERTTSFEEVPDAVDIGATPIIIAAGTSLYDSNKFYLCIDNIPVASASTIQDAFAALFSCFYVFNIEYTDSLATVLTYTQRVIAKINPQKGTKCSTAALTRKANTKVVTLNNKFCEFKQKLDEENQE